MKWTCLITGAVILGALWFGPLPGIARHSFSAHMALHMGVVAVAAPLLAIGLVGGRLDPTRRWPGWLPAVPLSIVELIVVWAWHAPALHHAARQVAYGFFLEQASFFVAGMLVWLSSVGGVDARSAVPGPGKGERAGAGIVALLLTSMHMTLLGALLALTPRALYAHGSHEGAAGMTSLEDQHLGGAIMLVIGGVAYLAGGLALALRLVRRDRLRSEARA